MNSRILIAGFQILLLGSVIGCRTYKPAVRPYTPGSVNDLYISQYKDLAISEMERTGVPASITLAQGMIESDHGRSRLAREANNHFGIKCHNNWRGSTIRHNDDSRNECFRKYRTAEESFTDHSDFLRTGSRYKSLFEIEPTDYKAWAQGLKKFGYATNPDYANMLIRKIEENGLYNYDIGTKTASIPTAYTVAESVTIDHVSKYRNVPAPVFNDAVAIPSMTSRISENNRIQYIIVRDGDTKEKLDKEFQLLKWELTRYNEIAGDLSLYPGQILYLQPKRSKAEPGKEHHICQEGETMYMISQKYGMKVKDLYSLNRMSEGTEPIEGQRLWLRIIKPVN